MIRCFLVKGVYALDAEERYDFMRDKVTFRSFQGAGCLFELLPGYPLKRSEAEEEKRTLIIKLFMFMHNLLRKKHLVTIQGNQLGRLFISQGRRVDLDES